MNTYNLTTSLLTLALFAAASPAFSSPVQIRHQDDPDHCDTLFIPLNADELGLGGIFRLQQWDRVDGRAQ